MPTYNKLVRDKIPEIIEAKGKEVSTTILSNEEYIKELKTKCLEEVDEYMKATTNEEAKEELADVPKHMDLPWKKSKAFDSERRRSGEGSRNGSS